MSLLRSGVYTRMPRQRGPARFVQENRFMTIKAATPYFIFNGQAEQAIAFYREALRAEVETVMRFGDMDQSCPEAKKNMVMHAQLKVGQTILMLSDGMGEGPLVPGGVVSVALDLGDADEMRRVFDALAVGGSVFTPIMDAPWGALFGVVTDKYAVSWMLNHTKAMR